MASEALEPIDSPTHEVAEATPSSPSPIVEFFVTGGAILFVIPLAFLVERLVGLDRAELAVGFTMFHAAHLVNDPHFTVTYLLFYRDFRANASRAASLPRRLHFWFVGVVAPLALFGFGACAIRFGSAEALGWLIQLMFVLVGFHYAKQGFGVLVVLARGRGVHYSRNERRALLVHAYAAWLFALCQPALPARLVEESGVVYTAFGIAPWLERASGAFFALSALVVLGLFLARRWRGHAIAGAPLAGYFATLWLLTVFTAVHPLVVYVIPALHSLQYLYFVRLLTLNEAREAEATALGPPALQRVALVFGAAILIGFAVFHLVPGLLDGALVPKPRDMTERELLFGATPWFALVFASVNVHHYLMDQLIWRRENPRMRFLGERLRA